MSQRLNRRARLLSGAAFGAVALMAVSSAQAQTADAAVQAAERAALVTVDNYRIDLDLTDGAGAPSERTFRSVTTVTFSASARRRVSRMNTVALNRSFGVSGGEYQSVRITPPKGSAETIGMKASVSSEARHR